MVTGGRLGRKAAGCSNCLTLSLGERPNAALKGPGDNYIVRQAVDERHADPVCCKGWLGRGRTRRVSIEVLACE